MNKSAIAVLCLMLIAFVASWWWVPTEWEYRSGASALSEDGQEAELMNAVMNDEGHRWMASRNVGRNDAKFADGNWDIADRRVAYRIVWLEQGLILLLGGSLLTFLIRRERRRKAAA